MTNKFNTVIEESTIANHEGMKKDKYIKLAGFKFETQKWIKWILFNLNTNNLQCN